MINKSEMDLAKGKTWKQLIFVFIKRCLIFVKLSSFYLFQLLRDVIFQVIILCLFEAWCIASISFLDFKEVEKFYKDVVRKSWWNLPKIKFKILFNQADFGSDSCFSKLTRICIWYFRLNCLQNLLLHFFKFRFIFLSKKSICHSQLQII